MSDPSRSAAIGHVSAQSNHKHPTGDVAAADPTHGSSSQGGERSALLSAHVTSTLQRLTFLMNGLRNKLEAFCAGRTVHPPLEF
jgi:hypothetical protein